jgi:hypothetical protein
MASALRNQVSATGREVDGVLLVSGCPFGSMDLQMRVSRAHQRIPPLCRSSLEARRHSIQVFLLEGAMCTKIPYANRWLARRVLTKLQEQGRPVQSIHPCFSGHRGAWHVTRQKRRSW